MYIALWASFKTFSIVTFSTFVACLLACVLACVHARPTPRGPEFAIYVCLYLPSILRPRRAASSLITANSKLSLEQYRVHINLKVSTFRSVPRLCLSLSSTTPAQPPQPPQPPQPRRFSATFPSNQQVSIVDCAGFRPGFRTPMSVSDFLFFFFFSTTSHKAPTTAEGSLICRLGHHHVVVVPVSARYIASWAIHIDVAGLLTLGTPSPSPSPSPSSSHPSHPHDLQARLLLACGCYRPHHPSY